MFALLGAIVEFLVSVGDRVVLIGDIDGASVASLAWQLSTSKKLTQSNSQSVRLFWKHPLPICS
jgi:hypothetical protein